MMRFIYTARLCSNCEEITKTAICEITKVPKKLELLTPYTKQQIIDCVAEKTIQTLSLYRLDETLYLYYEAAEQTQQALTPEMLFEELVPQLMPWPCFDGARKWVPMIDIYHAADPTDDSENWTRLIPPTERRGMLMRIKPDWLASYIFYHFQRQEEAIAAMNKTLVIALHENILFYYDELPEVPSIVPRSHLLDTHNTPIDWNKLMEPHFITWENISECYRRKRPLETVLSV